MKQNKLEQVDWYRHIVNSIDGSVYWKDLNGVYLGCNTYAARMVGLDSPDEIIGKTDFDLFSEDVAKQYRKNDNCVMESKTSMSVGERGISADGNFLFQLSSKKPLYDARGEIIGITGNTIDITDKKQFELIEFKQVSNESRSLIKAIQLVNDISLLIEQYKIDDLNKKLGKTSPEIRYLGEIVLSRREKQILYYLAMGKNPKDIANIIGDIEKKIISFKTVLSIINKKLYPKFDVGSRSQLLERAIKLKLIPLML
jgi:PAS domain S-box-containing protein